jgi:hypothetical protein
MSKTKLHPLRKGWNPDLSDLSKEEIEKVNQISDFFNEFLQRVDSQNKCYVYLENSISFDFKTGEFTTSISFEDYVKYLKGVYSNKDRFLSRWASKVTGLKGEYIEVMSMFGLTFMEELVTKITNLWDSVTPFTYQEAFAIKDSSFRALVFGTISITEMIKELDGKKISSASKTTIQNNYSPKGVFIDTTKLKNNYEVWEANGEKLGVNTKLYAVKCTCTTTGNTHFLWLPDGKFKNEPLKAIASTFYFFTDLIDHITGITRQGDTWYPEIAENETTAAIISSLTKDSEERHLTEEEYFRLVVSQS